MATIPRRPGYGLEFEAWLVARESALQRTGHLLTAASGRYVAGIQSAVRQQTGVMGDFIGIFDAATGDQVLDKELPGLSIDGQAWEGDSLLLVVEDRTGQEAIIRVGMDGAVTRTTRVVAGVPRPAVGRPPLTTLRLAETP